MLTDLFFSGAHVVLVMLTKTVCVQVNVCDAECTVESSRRGRKPLMSRAAKKDPLPFAFASAPAAPAAPAGVGIWSFQQQKLPDLYVWAHDISGIKIDFM